MGMFDFIEDVELRAKAEEAAAVRTKELEIGLQAKIDEAISGLRLKNEELLGEKKSIQEKLRKFSAISDPDKAMDALKFLQENEDAQLLKDGKVSELIDKRTSQMRLEHEQLLGELKKKAEEAEKGSFLYRSMYEGKILEDEIRAIAVKAGVVPEAVSDVLLRAKGIFTLAKDNTVEARDDKGNLVKTTEGNVLTPFVWMEQLKTTSPHYWPRSESAGARGGTPSAGDPDTMARLGELAKKGDMDGYRKLRAKMGK